MKANLLVIGDAHVKVGVSLERFKWLARYAYETKPDYIIDMGDWADMPSLSSYDLGKKSYEGRQYCKDIQAAVDARQVFHSHLEECNLELARRKKAKYAPKKISLGGNHDEGRISRVIDGDRKLEGLIGIKDFQYERFGWEYVPYQQPIEIQGFTFCHHFTSGVMGRPIGGEMPALSLLRKQFKSCVAGHTHVLDVANRTRPDARKIWGLVAGCFLAADQREDYAGPANDLWWRGVVTLRGCEDGDMESFELKSVEELKRAYD